MTKRQREVRANVKARAKQWAAIREAWKERRRDFQRLILDTKLLHAFVRDKTQRKLTGR